MDWSKTPPCSLLPAGLWVPLPVPAFAAVLPLLLVQLPLVFVQLPLAVKPPMLILAIFLPRKSTRESSSVSGSAVLCCVAVAVVKQGQGLETLQNRRYSVRCTKQDSCALYPEPSIMMLRRRWNIA